MSVVGLFAGIGGFELAFRDVGVATTMVAEIEPHAQAVLRSRFPGIEVRGDVADIDEIDSATSIVTAGFPCQNLSMAGDKSGITGAKSNVVNRMFKLIAASRVPTVVIENVPFMLQLAGGAAMTWLVTEFERLGYAWAYRVLDTEAFGLPQRRRRVFLVASTQVDPRAVLLASETPKQRVSAKPKLDKPLGFYWTEGRSGVGFTVDGIPPLKVGSSLGIASAPAVLFRDGEVLTPDPEGCERLQGFPSGWTGDAQGSNGKHRWRLIGNAVSVPVARWVAGRIVNPGRAPHLAGSELKPGDRWPHSAWGTAGERFGLDLSDQPERIDRPSIAEFRDDGWSRLSDRALDGFISRAEAGGLKMPDGFIDALRRAPRKVAPVRGAPK